MFCESLHNHLLTLVEMSYSSLIAQVLPLEKITTRLPDLHGLFEGRNLSPPSHKALIPLAGRYSISSSEACNGVVYIFD
jgi:hypothetical protein